jgi:hypothetical protein
MGNCSQTNFELISQYFHWFSKIQVSVSYRIHLRLSQFTCLVIFSTPTSTLGNHVGGIFSSRSNKQMIRIHARWVITVMKNAYRWIEAAMFNNPRCPMGGHVDIAALFNFTVSFFKFTCHPDPAGVGYFYFRPEAFTERTAETLRKCGILANVFRHNQDSFGCVKPWAVSAVPRHLYFTPSP